MTYPENLPETPYDIREDNKLPEFEAVCIWGDQNPCNETSGLRATSAEVMVWKSQHTDRTGHTRYRNQTSEYEEWVPQRPVQAPAPVPPRLEPAKVRRIQS